MARIWYDGWQDAHARILPAELARYYGYTGDGGVSKQRKRLALKMSVDKELSVRFNKLTRALSKYIVQV